MPTYYGDFGRRMPTYYKVENNRQHRRRIKVSRGVLTSRVF